MDIWMASEEAYKRGYTDGYKKGYKDRDTPMKPIRDLNSVPHYRCPNCNNAIVVYEFGYKYPHCKWCGQAIDWE